MEAKVIWVDDLIVGEAVEVIIRRERRSRTASVAYALCSCSISTAIG